MAIEIPRHRIDVGFSRSGGPGGQHVNRTETKVEIRFRLEDADWIPLPVRTRLAILFPGRVNADGDFVVVSSRHRSQSQNTEDCFAKLAECLERAARRPKKRVPTKPTRASKERRLEGKRVRSRRKRDRRWRGDD